MKEDQVILAHDGRQFSVEHLSLHFDCVDRV